MLEPRARGASHEPEGLSSLTAEQRDQYQRRLEEAKQKALEEVRRITATSTPRKTETGRDEDKKIEDSLLQSSKESLSADWPAIGEERQVRNVVTRPEELSPPAAPLSVSGLSWSEQVDQESTDFEESFKSARRRQPQRERSEEVYSMRTDRSFKYEPPRERIFKDKRMQADYILRTMMRERPRGHPTDEELKGLDVGEEIRVGRHSEFIYKRVKKDDILTIGDFYHDAYKSVEEGELINPSSTVWPMSDMKEEEELPELSKSTSPDLLRFV